MVRIGIVGLGFFMGMIHYLAYCKVAGAQVVALCSPEVKQLAGDWADIKGNFGPSGTVVDLSDHAKYPEIEGLLADPDVELVGICVPADAHAPLAILTLEACEHALFEEPMALSVADADRMLAEAEASGKLLMDGQVLTFFPEFAFALEAVRSGRYGKLRAADLTRAICPPTWSPALMDVTRSSGPAVDLHIHDTHSICVLCGVPKAVQSQGVLDGDAVVHLSTQYPYDAEPPIAASAISGAITQPGRPFAHGFDLYLEGATLAFGSAGFSRAGGVTTPPTVLPPDEAVERPALGSGDPVDSFAAELTAAVTAVQTGSAPPQLTGTLARQALALSWAEVESARRRQPIPIG